MKKNISRLCGILLLAALTTPLHAGKVLAEVEYFYAPDNTLVGKAFNGKRVNFEYDLRGQLLAVTDAEGNDLERYTYDPAGNRLSKTIDGVTTTYRYDNANQLVSSTSDGVTTQYRYDAAGRMVQAGDKTYYYNFGSNKVSEVRQNGNTIAKFEYNLDGQISKAVYGDKTEEFIWDGLALVWRSGVSYVNEPYITGGNPVLAGDAVLFNDMLGTTLAVNGNPVEMTSFGETDNASAFFTGKPMIEELGYSFLFRDYNPSHGRWTTADPLGYPDGWNNLAYVNNWVTGAIDRFGTHIYILFDFSGIGHCACIIGNPDDGYYTYNHGGVGFGYKNVKDFENPMLYRALTIPNPEHVFQSYHYIDTEEVDENNNHIYAYTNFSFALAELNIDRVGTEKEYDKVLSWETSSEQDKEARKAIRECIDKGFHCDPDELLFGGHNNCVDAVHAALDGARVDHDDPGYLERPADFWYRNLSKAVDLEYNVFKVGLIRVHQYGGASE